MALSDFLQRYAQENPGDITVKDFVASVPTGVKQTAESILGGFQSLGQSSFRGFGAVASGLTGSPLRPTGKFQEELFGTTSPITPSSFANEFGITGPIAPFAGFALGAADIVPGGQVSKNAAVKLITSVDNIDDALRILKRVDGIDPKIAQKFAANAVKINNTKSASSFVDNLIKETEKSRKITRGFVESAQKAVPNAKRIGGQYIPRSTDQLAIRAKNLIKENFQLAEQIALSGSDDKAVAVASELLKKYADDASRITDKAVKNALYDRAAEIANTLAPKLTEQGRAIQAASILGRLTPEGQLRFAAREIQRFNELNPTKKIPELTGEQGRFITEEMKAINEMSDGVARAARFQKLQNYVQDLVPTPLMQKIVAIWKAGLLTGIKTTGLNFFSNLSHGVSEIVKDVPAAAVDSVAALFTGKRTKTLTLNSAFEGIKEGVIKGKRYFSTGFDERNIGAKLDYKQVNFGKGPVAKAFQTYTDVVFRALGAGDQPFYYAALSRSLMDQALAEGINQGLKGRELVQNAYRILEEPTEQMIRYATADATTAVFQNQTKLGDAARTIQKIPGIGEIILPFGRTPSSVAMQIVNYSPVGIAKTIIENIGKGRFDQRLFSQGLGRGLTGTAVLAIGMELAKNGLVSLDYPVGDEREQKLQEIEGIKPNSVKIDGVWRSPIVLGPLGNIILIGAHFQNAIEKEGSPSEAMSTAFWGGLKSFTEQTFLTGISDAVNALNDPERYAKSYLPGLIASLVPTLVSDLARATDPLERRAETTLQRVQSRIPGARRGLEPQVDILGQERESVGNPLEILIDPTRPSKEKSTPVSKELRRLMDKEFHVSPTALGDRKGFKGLTQKENTALWKYAGQVLNQKLEALFTSEQYRDLPDDLKGKTIEKFIDITKTNARAAFVISKLNGLSSEEQSKELARLKESGVLTRDVLRAVGEFR